jgi:hypothetical protein
MKLRIVRIPRWTPTKRTGIILGAVNDLGFEERMTFVFQVLNVDTWEDIPIVSLPIMNPKETQNNVGFDEEF